MTSLNIFATFTILTIFSVHVIQDLRGIRMIEGKKRKETYEEYLVGGSSQL